MSPTIRWAISVFTFLSVVFAAQFASAQFSNEGLMTGGSFASAGAAGLGSALIFPNVDAGPEVRTLTAVTNTNSSLISCGDNFREGDVLVRFVYYDAAGDRLFVTGKNWPKLFEIELIKKGRRAAP